MAGIMELYHVMDALASSKELCGGPSLIHVQVKAIFIKLMNSIKRILFYNNIWSNRIIL